MALMLSTATSPDYFDVSIQRELPRYQGSVDKSNIYFLMAALLVATSGTMDATVSPVTASLYEQQIPGVSVVTEERATVTIPATEQIAKVLSFYSLGKSHLSAIVSVSRPALYAWIDGSSEPDTRNFKKIEVLYTIARELDPSLQNAIYHGFIERPISGYVKSLFDMFVSNEDLSTFAIRLQVKDAYDKTLERIHNMEQRRAASFVIPHSSAEQELIQEDNL